MSAVNRIIPTLILWYFSCKAWFYSSSSFCLNVRHSIEWENNQTGIILSWLVSVLFCSVCSPLEWEFSGRAVSSRGWVSKRCLACWIFINQFEVKFIVFFAWLWLPKFLSSSGVEWQWGPGAGPGVAPVLNSPDCPGSPSRRGPVNRNQYISISGWDVWKNIHWLAHSRLQ